MNQIGILSQVLWVPPPYLCLDLECKFIWNNWRILFSLSLELWCQRSGMELLPAWIITCYSRILVRPQISFSVLFSFHILESSLLGLLGFFFFFGVCVFYFLQIHPCIHLYLLYLKTSEQYNWNRRYIMYPEHLCLCLHLHLNIKVIQRLTHHAALTPGRIARFSATSRTSSVEQPYVSLGECCSKGQVPCREETFPKP